MRIWHSLSVLAALSGAASACASGPRSAEGFLASPMAPQGAGAVLAARAPAPAPKGLAEWCARQGECARGERPDGASIFARLIEARARGDNPAYAREEMMLTPERWHELRAVNREVNAAIVPIADATARGVEDYWGAPLGDGAYGQARMEGDCEDYALEKRNRLRALGWQSGALLLAVVEAAGGAAHAVLIVQTDRGDIVLDNLSDEPRPAHHARYEWVSRQDGPSLLAWVEVSVLERDAPARLEAGSSPQTGAARAGFNWRPLLRSRPARGSN